MSNFDERSGIVASDTEWGRWWQTIDDITIEINVPSGTRGRDVKCSIQPRQLNVSIKDASVIKGELFKTIQPDESVWTLEDQKVLRICLLKMDKNASSCWTSLLANQYQANPLVLDEMEKKLTLQRFQMENPGMDFSGASITGNYHGGGPELSS